MSTWNLRDELRAFVDSMPPDDELFERRQAPKGPQPVTYIGRPNWCPGALGRRPNANGEMVDVRRGCRNEVDGNFGLCSGCAEVEERERGRRRDRLAGAEQDARTKTIAVERGVISRVRPKLPSPSGGDR